MKSPYLVKQFVSSDTQKGSFSKFFWLYKPKNNPNQLGLGMFLEVVSGDLDDSNYEFLGKLMWDTFVNNFAKKGFEVALQKASFEFLQYLSKLEVDQIDVNFAFWAISRNGVQDNKQQKLESSDSEQEKSIGGDNKDVFLTNLAVVGEVDVILLRAGELIKLHELAPQNTNLREIKYVELDLIKGDLLFVSNRYLVENAIQTEVIKYGNIEELLNSLKELEKDLTGNKKVFFLGVQIDKDIKDIKNGQKSVSSGKNNLENKQVVTLAEHLDNLKITLSHHSKGLRKFKDKIRAKVLPVFDSVKKKFEHKNKVNKQDTKTTNLTEGKESSENKVLSVNSALNPVNPLKYLEHKSDNDAGGEEGLVSEDGIKQEEGVKQSDLELDAFKEKQVVNTEEGVVSSEAGAQQEKEYETSIHMQLDDSISDSNPVGASSVANEGQLEVNSDAEDKSEKSLEFEQKRRLSPVEELRLRRSVTARLKHKVLTAFNFIVEYIKTKRRSKTKRMFIPNSNYSAQNRKKTLVYVIGTILIFIWIGSLIKSYHAKKQERLNTQVFIEKNVNSLLNFYNNDIKAITNTDPDHLLELCLKNSNQVLQELGDFKSKLKHEENIQKVQAVTAQVDEVKKECQDKFDKVHNIVRIKDAKLVKDFTADLGANTDIEALTIQKGYIYVVDRGKKAIYQINPANGRSIKLEDPGNYLQDPVDMGVNQDKILVCDKVSGLLEYVNDEFKPIVGTSKDSLGETCTIVRGFYTNAYFVLESRDKLYKSVGFSAGYSLPSVYINNVAKIKDVIIDGNIYLLRDVKGKIVLERYFQGRKDNSFKLKEDLTGVDKGYSNPSGNFPLYLLNTEKRELLVVEKPTAKKHPGFGVVTKRIILEDAEKFKDIADFAVDLSLHTNKEEFIYFVSGNALWRIPVNAK